MKTRIQNSIRARKVVAMLGMAIIFTTAPGWGGTCDAKMADFQTWLQANPSNRVQAIISSHNSSGVVTYTETVRLKGVKVNGVISANLVTDVSGTEYFSNERWAPAVHCPAGQICSSPPTYPFSPKATKTLLLSITSAAAVTVTPPGTVLTHSFAATCTGGLMYGVYAVPALPFNPGPLYTITFTKYNIPAPPR